MRNSKWFLRSTWGFVMAVAIAPAALGWWNVASAQAGPEQTRIYAPADFLIEFEYTVHISANERWATYLRNDFEIPTPYSKAIYRLDLVSGEEVRITNMDEQPYWAGKWSGGPAALVTDDGVVIMISQLDSAPHSLQVRVPGEMLHEYSMGDGAGFDLPAFGSLNRLLANQREVFVGYFFDDVGVIDIESGEFTSFADIPGEICAEFSGDSGATCTIIGGVDISLDGRWLGLTLRYQCGGLPCAAQVADSGVALYDRESGTFGRIGDESGQWQLIAISPDGARALVTAGDLTAPFSCRSLLYEVADAAIVEIEFLPDGSSISLHHRCAITGEFSPDGNVVAFNAPPEPGTGNTLFLRNLNTNQVRVATIPKDDEAFGVNFEAVPLRLDNNGRRAYFGAISSNLAGAPDDGYRGIFLMDDSPEFRLIAPGTARD